MVTQISQFAPGVLNAVRALGGQFAQARMTEVPGGETFESQYRDRITEFEHIRHNYGYVELFSELSIATSLASQVIYLPGLVKGSLDCTYGKFKGGWPSVEKVFDSLPKVEGLRWIVGNIPTIIRVMANHQKETGEYLLHHVYTWTAETAGFRLFFLKRDKPGYLIVGNLGCFAGVDISIRSLDPADWSLLSHVGLFVLGVPEVGR